MSLREAKGLEFEGRSKYERLMTIKEVAAYLCVADKTVYRLLKQGTLPAVRVGRQWRFEKASIDDWLHRNSVGAKHYAG